MHIQLDQVTYVARGEELAWGFVLLGISLIIHGFGMVLTLQFTNSFKHRFGTSYHLLSGIATVIPGAG